MNPTESPNPFAASFRRLILLWLMASVAPLLAGEMLFVNTVAIIGAKKTEHWVILAEMTFAKGDSIEREGLDRVLVKNQQNIYNLSLFTQVEIQHEILEGRLYVFLTVAERWYLLGQPVVKLEERSTYDVVQAIGRLDFKRLSFGLSADWRNVAGKNETLSFYGQLGFSQRLRITFNMPRFFRKEQTDLFVGFDYRNEKEIIYGTEQAKVRWGRYEPSFLQRSYAAFLGVRKRFSIYTSLSAQLAFVHYQVADTMYDFTINGEPVRYLTNPDGREYYPSLILNFVRDYRDLRSFPLKGTKLQIFLRVTGIKAISTTEFAKIGVTWTHHIPLAQRWFFTYGIHNIFTFGDRLPYYEKTFIGIKRYEFAGLSTDIRGYEPYAIDASFQNFTRAELKFAVVPRHIVPIPWFPVKRFQYTPFGIYISAFVDAGYMRDATFSNQDPYLKDQLLMGYGVGLNIIGIYDRLLRVEYTRNLLGQGGVYIHGSVSIK